MIQNNLTDAIVSQASLDLKNKNYSIAIDEFVKAISRGTQDSYAYYGLAKAYQATGVNDKATEYYEKAIKMDPDRTEYSKDFAEFISEINKPSEIENTNTKEVSNVVITLGGVTPANDNSYIQNIEKNKTLILEGDNNYKKKNYDSAIKNYKEALQYKPSDEETLLKIGNLYKLKQDEKNAIDYYKKAIFVKPEYADGWFNLGLVYADQKNIVQSKKCFEKTISINPKYAYAYYALASANEAEDNSGEAIKNYEKFLKYNTDNSVKSAVEERIKSLKK
jgi:tetratricopeptide (TPR) repeat protein